VLAFQPAFACSGHYAGTNSEGDSAGVMMVKSGKWCGYRFRSSLGPTYGVKIVRQPSHGSVRVNSRHGVYYRSRPGYVGTDTFAYARYGLTMQNAPRTTRAAIITVNVTP
jgi:hypothetical protein